MPRARCGREPGDEVVLEVRADLGGIDQDVDAVLGEVGGRTDAAQHQQLRGVDGAAGEDHLASSERVPGDAVDLDVDAGRPRMRLADADIDASANVTRRTSAPVTTRRLRRLPAGRRYASAVDARAPRRCETIVCEKPCPSGRFATVTGWPSSRAAPRNAAVCGRGSR